jgi:riboflavin kinase / FMN adenylyltransferase
MRLYSTLEELPAIESPVVLTLGNFDGVHLGHQALLNRVKALTNEQQALSAVLTFTNHPSVVLRPDHQITPLCSPEEKRLLLEKVGIDLLLMVEFTPQFAEQTAEQLIVSLRKKLPLTTLVMGYDAVIGKGRAGDRTTLQQLAEKYHFGLEYIAPIYLEGQLVSSSKIRALIRENNLPLAEKLLGRPL